MLLLNSLSAFSENDNVDVAVFQNWRKFAVGGYFKVSFDQFLAVFYHTVWSSVSWMIQSSEQLIYSPHFGVWIILLYRLVCAQLPFVLEISTGLAQWNGRPCKYFFFNSCELVTVIFRHGQFILTIMHPIFQLEPCHVFDIPKVLKECRHVDMQASCHGESPRWQSSG